MASDKKKETTEKLGWKMNTVLYLHDLVYLLLAIVLTFLLLFRIIACLLVFAGAQLSFGLVWDIADVLMGVMALINLPVIVLLGKTAMKTLQDYTAQRKAGLNPVFKAETVGLQGQVDFWN